MTSWATGSERGDSLPAFGLLPAGLQPVTTGSKYSASVWALNVDSSPQTFPFSSLSHEHFLYSPAIPFYTLTLRFVLSWSSSLTAL